MPNSGAAPLVGVTAVLFALWLLAALLGGPLAPAATALDPALPGSLGAVWGDALLLSVLAAGLAGATPRRLSMVAAVLLAGELGSFHLVLAPPVAAALALPAPSVKAGLAAVLGLLALVLLAHLPRTSRPVWSLRICVAAGIGAGALDGLHAGPVAADVAWLAAGEEWCEILVATMLGRCALATLPMPSRFGTKWRAASTVVAAGCGGLSTGPAAVEENSNESGLSSRMRMDRAPAHR